MKRLLFLVFVVIAQYSFANMASPLRIGTLSSTAFSSRDIDILKEKIFINIYKDSQTALYVIEYHVKSNIDGMQIPLLFYAMDYKGSFKISIDNKEVQVLNVPNELQTALNSPFEKFSNSFDQPSQIGEIDRIVISWDENSNFLYELHDLKYFEADLSKGEHLIRVEYVANAWTDVSDWVKEYSFRYSLSPAKHWKSFGSLEVVLNSEAVKYNLKTNLGLPQQGKLNSVAFWNFEKLPADYIIISYKPEIDKFASFLIAIGPSNLSLLFAILLFIIHIFVVILYRKHYPTNKFSPVVIIGSVFIPLLFLISYILSFNFIDSAIGSEAGRHHGYVFLVLILYPLITPVYWLILWLLDRWIKRKQMKTRTH